ncbi:MAG: outer membrane lipoprotein chaperone LolA [Gammaproteobacteria bacterium WSBS_2016_MAG_OTU1]
MYINFLNFTFITRVVIIVSYSCLLATWTAMGEDELSATSKGGVAMLRQFLNSTQQAKIVFHQTAFDQKQNIVGKSRGQFWYKRPHLFRMEYDPPNSIVIVSDGEQTWTYEPDLKQVIIQSVSKLSGASALLEVLASGNLDDLQKKYILSSGIDGAMRWAIAETRAEDQAIRKLRLGFIAASGELERVEITDSFGSRAQLNISLISRQDEDVAADLFKFVPPIGVDIVRE